MTQSHTPGPWMLDANTSDVWYTAENARDYQVATAYGDSREGSGRANARLITAAPDMLNALQKLRRGDLPDNEQPLWNEIQAVIAKAKGE